MSIPPINGSLLQAVKIIATSDPPLAVHDGEFLWDPLLQMSEVPCPIRH